MLNQLHEQKEMLRQEGIFFSFCGPISQALTVEIGNVLKRKMTLAEVSSSTILKVFAVVVEQVQNILHYSAEKVPMGALEEDDAIRFGTIWVGSVDDRYVIECGNEIENDRVDSVRQQLSPLQVMDSDELKKYYKTKRREKTPDGSKGAGLGFIDMARKSSEPLEFNFDPINEQTSFFSIKVTI